MTTVVQLLGTKEAERLVRVCHQVGAGVTDPAGVDPHLLANQYRRALHVLLENLAVHRPFDVPTNISADVLLGARRLLGEEFRRD